MHRLQLMIDAATTIEACDETIKKLANPQSVSEDIVRLQAMKIRFDILKSMLGDDRMADPVPILVIGTVVLVDLRFEDHTMCLVWHKFPNPNEDMRDRPKVQVHATDEKDIVGFVNHVVVHQTHMGVSLTQIHVAPGLPRRLEEEIRGALEEIRNEL